MIEPIINRVEESDILVFNLEEFWDGHPIEELDIEPFLLEGLVVREKLFREKVRDFDWEQFEDAHVAVFCSTDAIIPTWAFMLIASRLEGIARSVTVGRKEDLIREHFARALAEADLEEYRDRPVVVKGCGSKIVPPSAYVAATRRLQEVASKLMYGEPCSSVPLWRKAAEKATAEARPAGVKKPAIPASLQRDA